MNDKPKRQFVVIAGIVITLGFLTLFFRAPDQSASFDSPDSNGPLFADETVERAKVIQISTAEGIYRLVAEDDGWVIPEKADARVGIEKIDRLLANLKGLELTEAMTALPERFDELGLGDPESGGYGAKLQLGSDGPVVILGVKNDQQFVRAPGETQTYRVNQLLPPLHRAVWWLADSALAVPDLSAGLEGFNERSEDSADADLAFLKSVLSELEFDDVRASLNPVGRSATLRYSSGDTVTVTLTEEDGTYWISLDGDHAELSDGRFKNRSYRIDALTASDLTAVLF